MQANLIRAGGAAGALAVFVLSFVLLTYVRLVRDVENAATAAGFVDTESGTV